MSIFLGWGPGAGGRGGTAGNSNGYLMACLEHLELDFGGFQHGEDVDVDVLLYC